MPLGPLPSPGPFGRIVDVRVFPHGFTTEQGAIIRPNIEDADWHAAASPKWGGNIVWTGSTPRHTVAYNGPRGRYFGPLVAGGSVAMTTWFSHNGVRVTGPSGRVLAACVKTYADLPTSQAYDGTGDGTLEVQEPSTAPGALTGDYEVRCIEAAPVPRFLVTGPDAQPIGVAEAGPLLGAPVLFDGVVRFTLQAGTIAFAAGDTWTLTVEEAEQFVAITTPAIDSTPQTEKVWRRGVSLTPGSSWRELAAIAPVSGQVNGSIQPWFFNASATQAVTCRGLGEDAGGFTLGTAARSLNISTLSVSDSVHYGGKIVYAKTSTITSTIPNPSPPPEELADTATVVNSTVADGPFDQLMARDFIGDAMTDLSLRVTGSCEGSSSISNITSEPKYATLSGSYSAAASLVWSGGTSAELLLFSVSASGSRTHSPDTWESTRSLTFSHKILRDIAGPSVDVVAYTAYDGVVSVEWDNASEDYLETATAVTLSHVVSAGTVAAVTGGSGPTPAGEPGYSSFWMELPSTADSWDTDSTETLEFGGLRGLSSTWAMRVITFTDDLGSDAILGSGGLPAVNTTTGKGMQTSAQDTRGNWIMTAEIASFGTADMSWPGSISGSGTYTTQAGGPDALTPSLVATLTGYAPHDRWDIGAF